MKWVSKSSADPLLLRENEKRNRGIKGAQRKRKKEEKSLKRRRTVTPPGQNPAVSILSLPPEVLENILIRLSVPDVVSFGSTCRYFHKLSLSQAVWKNLYFENLKGPAPSRNDETNWRRLTILKMSQGLVLQRVRSSSGRGKAPLHHLRSRQLTHSMSFNAPMALGFRRVVPILDHTVLWDYKGTIFVLFTPRRNVMWRRPLGYSILCNDAKDSAWDPPAPRIMCDCVEVFQWDTHKRVFRMTFHFSLNFTQLRLCGPENKRTVLLLTDTGKVYAMSMSEIQLNNSCPYTTQLTLKNVSKILPELPIKQIHTSFNSILYIRADGSVFIEVHSIGTYYQLFGTYAGHDTYDAQTVIPLMLPYKVVKCSLGLSHLCLLDDCGRVFMQGCNRYGQLGTGDKIDRGEPTMVIVSMAPVDVWCGLNHTLALLQTESGDKELQGCGCGSKGRLPGCWTGSPVFVRLSVQVPRAASSLCSSKECLFLMCSHDIAEPPAPHYIPPGTEDEKDIERGQEEEKQRMQIHLTQMKSCDSAKRQIIMLQSAVKQHLTGLSPVHKDFFDTALSIILDHCTRAKMEPEEPSEA
ncbi:F-box only protein 24-like [Colossoma macropomum]|uniref:F-box only protein 24-like n=1 Tax=Colossoma macropomum TaxID=42526 RepID=UPI0018641F82|nr:F-box only protein 24-like [Colossoma macropomum]